MNAIEVSTLTFSIQAFVTLLVILDPPGATPIFLGLVADKSKRERVQLAWQAALVSLVVITFFSLFGRFILEYMNVSIEALQAAGGLLLLYVSLELLTGRDMGGDGGKDKNIIKDAGVTLLARIAGLLLAAIAVQMLVDAIKAFSAQ